MHIVLIIAGAFTGAWLINAEGLFGGVVGMLIGSLLWRAAETNRKLGEMRRRIADLESRPQQPVTAASAKAKVPRRVSIYEPEPIVKTPELPTFETPPPDAVDHERAPEPPRSAGIGEHSIAVAKRWLTTGNMPVKVGVIISFFGVAFLLKYAVEAQVLQIPISVRYLGVAAFAAVLLALGWRMRDGNRVYALSLQGGGIGVLYLTVFAAFRLHDLLPPILAFALLVLVTVAAGYLAVVQESRAFAILGTSGGFLAPLLVSTGSGDHVALFGYYLLLNSAVLGIAWYRPWRELNIIGFVFTFGVGTLWGYQFYTPELFASTEPFLVAYFLFYTAIAVLFAFRQKPELRGYVDGTLLFGTPTIAFALQSQLVNDTEYGLSISAAVVAAFYTLMALWLRRRREQNFDLLTQSFIALAVAFGTVAIPLALDDRWTALAWAMEGSALVWIGVRQGSNLGKVSGAVLAFAGGLAFLNYGWTNDLGIPVLNGNLLGGVIIALSGLYSSRMLLDDDRGHDWQKFAAIALLGWGVLWWFGAGTMEVLDRAPQDNELHLLLLFYAASFAAMAVIAQRYQWVALMRTTQAFLPTLLFMAFAYLSSHDHFFVGLWSLSWIAAIAAHIWILYARKSERGGAERIMHGGGALFLAAILAYELYWQIDKVVANDVWSFTAGLAVLSLAAFAYVIEKARSMWPCSENAEVYHQAATGLIAAFLLLLTVACIDGPGNPSPLPYMPILNPFDILTVIGLAVAWFVSQATPADSTWRGAARSRALFSVLGGIAFVLATFAVIRAVHHFAGIPWDQRELMSSVGVQSTLSIYWALLGLGGMVLGTRRASRGVWMVGAALMVVVVAKLFVVDLGSTGTVARIVSFLGVGVTLLVVGYLSPVPPKQPA